MGELWHVRIGVVVDKLGGCVVVDERVIDEPVDRAALAKNVEILILRQEVASCAVR